LDNIFTEEKLLLRLTFNPGLALTGFRTTRPEDFLVDVSLTILKELAFMQKIIFFLPTIFPLCFVQEVSIYARLAHNQTYTFKARDIFSIRYLSIFLINV